LLLGLRRVEVVGIGVDRGADGFAPTIVAEGFGVFMLGDLNTLHHDLGEVGEGRSGFGFNVALSGGGKDAAQRSVEVAGGEITAREEISGIATDIFGGLGLRVFAGMERAELQITGLARSAAAAAVGEGKGTQGRTVLRAK
jgi:hypothetical protein